MPLLVFKLPKKEVMKSSELGKDVIRKELPLIPKSPGVYRMLDHKDVILYVGKAKNLPNRLKSYCLLYTSPSPRDEVLSRMPSSA